MASDDGPTGFSQTVSQVINQFFTTMRADDGIDNNAIDRLEILLNKGVVPKSGEINTALFNSIEDDGA